MFDYSNFHYLSCAYKKGALIVKDVAPYFKNKFAFFASKEKPLRDLVFKHHMGKNLYDVVATAWGLLLLSDRFVEILRSNNFTGWDVIPARFTGPDGETIDNYSHLIISGKCGPLIKSMSSDVMVEYPAGWSKEKKGLFFASETYDGSDFFLPEGTSWKFITQRVRDILIKEKITNISLEPIIEITYNPDFF